MVTLLFLTGLFEDLPEATLAAVVIAALIDLVDVPALVRLYRFHTRGAGRALALAARPDFAAAIAAVLGVLVFDTLPGLFIGIAVSLLLLLYRASRPHVAVLGKDPGAARWSDLERHPDSRPAPGIVVLRPESGMFFANAEAIRQAVRRHAGTGTRAVVLDAETVPAIDVTAVGMLVALAADVRERGTELVIARDIAGVRDLMATAEPSRIRTFPTVQAAVDALRHT
jgi:sulfate permease, SulP family